MATNKRPCLKLQLLGICFVASLLSACQPSMEDVVTKHRAAVEAVFTKLKSLDAMVRSTPPPATDAVATGTEHVLLEGEESNALFIRADDLHAPERTSSDTTGTTRANTVKICGEALRGEAMGVPAGVESFLKACERARYVFVLRKAAESSAELADNDSFAAGGYAGDVLLFRLADGALLGGFRVSAQSSDQVMARVDADGKPIDVSDRLQSDLSANLFADIDTKLRKYVPGVIK